MKQVNIMNAATKIRITLKTVALFISINPKFWPCPLLGLCGYYGGNPFPLSTPQNKLFKIFICAVSRDQKHFLCCFHTIGDPLDCIIIYYNKMPVKIKASA